MTASYKKIVFLKETKGRERFVMTSRVEYGVQFDSSVYKNAIPASLQCSGIGCSLFGCLVDRVRKTNQRKLGAYIFDGITLVCQRAKYALISPQT